MKLPDSAKLVFKGEIFDTYQWEQKLYDGSVSTYEGLKRPDTIQIIPIVEGPSNSSGQGKILLSYEEQPNKPLSHTFLGGRAEEGEEPLFTAKRELLEEAGVESDDWELLKVYQNEGKIDWNIYLFIARNCKKVSEQHLDPGEKIEVKEVGWEEFLNVISAEDFWGRDIANDILRIRLDPKKLEELRQKLFRQS